MSAELVIPDAAYAAGELAAVRYVAESEAIDIVPDVLHAGAPLIVAAELRRLADELIGEEDPYKIWRAISRRADELDGGAA